MANEITARKDAFIAAMNDNVIKAQLKRSLNDGSGAFMSSMIDLFEGDKSLQACDPVKVVAECVKAAALNLPIVKSLGFAYVVPYKNVPTFIIGYKGLIQLAQRTGQYKTINADVVYEGEMRGLEKLSGNIDLSGERISDKVIGYFAYFKTVYGFEKILYMTKSDVEAWANKYSKSVSSPYSPWQTEFDKMALKTVLSRLLRTYGIMTTELQEAFRCETAEEQARKEIEQSANTIVIDVNGEVRETVAETVTETVAKTVPESEPNF